MDHLKKFVNGFEGKSIAYIPTAANGEGWETWRDAGAWKLVNSLGANIELVQLEEYRNESVVERLRGKDIV